MNCHRHPGMDNALHLGRPLGGYYNIKRMIRVRLMIMSPVLAANTQRLS